MSNVTLLLTKGCGKRLLSIRSNSMPVRWIGCREALFCWMRPIRRMSTRSVMRAWLPGWDLWLRCVWVRRRRICLFLFACSTRIVLGALIMVSSPCWRPRWLLVCLDTLTFCQVCKLEDLCFSFPENNPENKLPEKS